MKDIGIILSTTQDPNIVVQLTDGTVVRQLEGVLKARRLFRVATKVG